jgi:hypothetical protein
MQGQLFNQELTVKVKPKDTCQHCLHLVEHNYNSSMKYCAMQKDSRTALKLKRIKSRDKACPMFERFNKKPAI